MPKAEAVSLVVNMLIGELLSRSKREEGYRDYFDLAVMGYGNGEVCSLLPYEKGFFVPISCLAHAVRRRVKLHKERLLPNGRTAISVIDQRIWVEPCAQGNTPMCEALQTCAQLLELWCRQKNNRKSYPPTVINITDGEASDADSEQLKAVADQIKSLHTEDGHVLLINIHLAARLDDAPLLFPTHEEELPEQRYARLLYAMSSPMPAPYRQPICALCEKTDGEFRGMSYNTNITDLICMMNIGSVSTTLIR